ncbi:restriction endonuclease subunit S, partial [Mycoplasma sp. CSL7475-4]|uniref:restriction endonuclease subunit S n=1 Tax=Mycoplasma sp. CSL7475-4 TaxID=2973942 RepID=UPI00216B543F
LQRKLEKLENIKNTLLEKMFASAKSSYPAIRFKGFTNAWEQKNFKSLYYFASEGGTPSTKNGMFYKNGKVPFVKINDMFSKYIWKTDSYITEKGVLNSSAWIMKANNLILSNGATIGKTSINKVDLATKQGILGILLNDNFDLEYIYYLLNTSYFQNELKVSSYTTTIPTLPLKVIDKIKLFITNNKTEMKKISSFFSSLESTVSLLQRKLEKLENIKNTLLEKMFV